MTEGGITPSGWLKRVSKVRWVREEGKSIHEKPLALSSMWVIEEGRGEFKENWVWQVMCVIDGGRYVMGHLRCTTMQLGVMNLKEKAVSVLYFQ